MGGRVAEEARRRAHGVVWPPLLRRRTIAERAVRAALAIQRTLAELNLQETLARAAQTWLPASASTAGRWWWMRPEKSLAMR